MSNTPDPTPYQSNQRGPAWLRFFASTKLTLGIMAFLILLALAGAIVPQQGMLEETAMTKWQLQHPVASPVSEKLGLFAVFHSLWFLVSLGALFLNTLACTFLSMVKDGLFSGNEPSLRLRRVGFLILHISILVCMAGGFISAALRTSGKIILTEGQTIQDQHQNYSELIEGPLRKEQHNRFSVELIDADYKAPTDWSVGRKRSSVRLSSKEGEICIAEVTFNRPFQFQGLTFTIQEIGFSPEIFISSRNPQTPPLSSFVALKVWGVNKDREHRDFLPLPHSDRRLLLNLLPSHSISDGAPVKTSEILKNPALLVHLEYSDGTETPNQLITPGHSVDLADLSIQFGEVRRWASFLVVEDPGYPIVCISFWMAIIALLLRYSPDVTDWIKEARQDGAG